MKKVRWEIDIPILEMRNWGLMSQDDLSMGRPSDSQSSALSMAALAPSMLCVALPHIAILVTSRSGKAVS